MALVAPGAKKMAGTVTAIGGGGAPALPAADAGADQACDGRPTITLDGSGSAAGSTYAWLLTNPYGDNVTSLLSSSTAQSPTFKPQDVPGLYTAKIAVTKGGLTSYDSCNVTVGIYGGEYIRLIPSEADSTYDSGNYASTTWSDDGTWTTMVLGDKAGSIQNPTDTQVKWFASSVTDWRKVATLEFRIVCDASFVQPALAQQCFVGLIMGPTANPADGGQAHVAFRTDVGTPMTGSRISQRGGTTSWGWGSTKTGADTAYGALTVRVGIGRIVQIMTGKWLSTTDTGFNSETYSSMALNLDTYPVHLGLFVGRVAAGGGDQTMKFKVYYRINLQEGL
jgi:hypothetical protein